MAFDYLGMLRSDTADLTEDEKGTGTGPQFLQLGFHVTVLLSPKRPG